MSENTVEKEKHLANLIRIWEENGNDEEELLLDDLDLDVKIETTEHMLKMGGIEF